MKIAACFSITGRDSEISASEDLVRYEEYRSKCAEHLNKFLDESLGDISVEEKQRLSHIVRYMGNPNYEKSVTTPINTHPIEEEKKLRNYMHRILTIAHKLDLPRCYNKIGFQNSMKLAHELSKSTPQQEKDLYTLAKYAIKLIKAHGAMLHCDYDKNTNSYINVNYGYKSRYVQNSTSLSKLAETTETVKKPRFFKS